MTLTPLINRPCKILTRVITGEDDYGNDTHEDTVVDTVCELQSLAQRKSNEDEDHNQLSSTTWKLFLNTGETITARDAVVVDGERYELAGEVSDVWNPRTQLISHIEATVIRTSTEEGS